MKKEAKQEVKDQGKEWAAGEIDSMIDGMSEEELARHYCAREGWEGACWGPGPFPPHVQKGPGNRCDCTPGYCWEYTGKKDPWYAYGWECRKDRSNLNAWIEKNAKNKKDKKNTIEMTDHDNDHGDDKSYEELGALLTVTICPIVACCCLSACFYKLVRRARAGKNRGRDNGPMPLQVCSVVCVRCFAAFMLLWIAVPTDWSNTCSNTHSMVVGKSREVHC
jgi:hypothetical protein